MALGVISFSLFAVSANSNKAAGVPEDNFILYCVAVILFVGAIFGGQHFYKKVISESKEETLGKKLSAYRKGVIIHLALFEGTALFGTFTFFESNDMGFLVLAAICVFAFRLLKPTKEKMIRDLTLNTEELRILSDPVTSIDV